MATGSSDSVTRAPSRRFTVAVLGVVGAGFVLRLAQIFVARPTCPRITTTPTGEDCFRVWGDAVYGYWQGSLIADGHWFKDPVAWFLEGGGVREAAGKPPLYPMFLGALSRYGSPSTPTWQAALVALVVLAAAAWACRRFLSPLVGGVVLVASVVAVVAFRVADGSSPTSARVAFAICGTVAIGLIAVTVRDMVGGSHGERAGLIAAVIAALHPLLWINDGMLQVESLYALVVVWTILAAYRWWRSPTTSALIVLSVALAAAAMIRAEGQLLVPVTMIPLAWRARGLGIARKVGSVAVAFAVALVMWSPWLVWNQARFEAAPVGAMTTGSGAVLVSAYCDETFFGEALGYWAAHCFEMPRTFAAERDTTLGDAVDDGLEADGLATRLIEAGAVTVSGVDVRDPDAEVGAGDEIGVTLRKDVLDDSEIDLVARATALGYATDHLRRVPVVAVARVARMYDLYRPFDTLRINWQVEGRGRLPSTLGLVVHWALLPVAVAGAVVLWRRRVTLVPLLAHVVAVTVTAAMTFGVTRYRVPVDICEILLASIAIDAWWSGRDRSADPVDVRTDPETDSELHVST
ncbi:MAG TPA: glycosyltransferase family 39 protein [Microthrixaceae bacterium]|nr:glycosyltransferase family 39 protein [Microthrixaceae bacterium]